MDQCEEARHRLERLCDVVDLVSHCEKRKASALSVACWLELADYKMEDATLLSASLPQNFQVCVLVALVRAIPSP